MKDYMPQVLNALHYFKRSDLSDLFEKSTFEIVNSNNELCTFFIKSAIPIQHKIDLLNEKDDALIFSAVRLVFEKDNEFLIENVRCVPDLEAEYIDHRFL